MKKYTNLKQAVEQLEFCKFEDEIGHPLENNTAFQFIKKLSTIKSEPVEDEYYVTYNKILDNGMKLKNEQAFMTKKQIESKNAYDNKFNIVKIKKL